MLAYVSRRLSIAVRPDGTLSVTAYSQVGRSVYVGGIVSMPSWAAFFRLMRTPGPNAALACDRWHVQAAGRIVWSKVGEAP